MEDRNKRHAALITLLKEKRLSNQSQVVSEMVRKGFDVTQSSISRDFKDLGILKFGGIYTPAQSLGGSRSKSLVQRYISSVASAGSNLVVVTTSTGAASAIAEEIDCDRIDGVVGTVAGDNTIFIATKNRTVHERIFARIRSL